VRDETGTKMSKSLGNIIDPLQIIDRYGADALRFSIISITAVGQDLFLSEDKFEMGRNFANKLWNVSRFLLMNLKSNVESDLCSFFEKEDLSLADRWILSSLYRTMELVVEALDSYKFNEAARLLYEFIWHRYCDWYVEIAKLSIDEQKTQLILYKVLEKSLRMLHPFMPFVTEEIWQKLEPDKPIMASSWPHLQKQIIDNVSEKKMERVIDIIVAIRNIRAEVNVGHKNSIDVIISTSDKEIIGLKDELSSYANKLSNVRGLKIEQLAKRPKLSASSVLDSCEIFIPLEGLIDVDVEKKRLGKSLQNLESALKGLDKKLKNKAFVERAPKEVVEREKERQAGLKDKAERIKRNIEDLS